MNSRVVPQKICGIPLGPAAGVEAGPLHTIVQERKGPLFCSDEFNHRIICLSGGGEVLWIHGGRGKGEGQLWYPRGIELGWIRVRGKDHRCLAVCDAWNGRVQFLDLEGRLIRSCNSFSDVPFDNVCDIRFIAGSPDKDSARGYWLVLDSGNHRVCGLNASGEPLFQVGRPLHSRLESRWKRHGLDPLTDSLPEGIARSFALHDPLYYPARILGNSESLLCLWEPLSRRVKQILLGNLFALRLSLPADAEWIGADADGFWSWEASTRTVCFYDARGEPSIDLPIGGTPVSSRMPAGRIWIQSCDEIAVHGWDRGLPDGPRAEPGRPFACLWQTATAEIAAPPAIGAESSLLDLQRAVDKFLSGCDRLLALAQGEAPATHAFWLFMEEMNASRDGLDRAVAQLSIALQPYSLASLKMRLLSAVCGSDYEEERLRVAQTAIQRLVAPIHQKTAELLQRLDDTVCLRLSRQEAGDESRAAREKMDCALAEQCVRLTGFLGQFENWSGVTPLDPILVAVPCRMAPGTPATAVFSAIGESLLAPPRRLAGTCSRLLKEVDRVLLVESDHALPAQPCCVARARDGHLFVSLSGIGSIAHLDAQGATIGPIRPEDQANDPLALPTGLAFDGAGRLWVSEYLGNRLRVYDRRLDRFNFVPRSRQSSTALLHPFGICPASDGSILVADSGNARIVSVTEAGVIRPLCGGEGGGMNALRRPISLTASVASQQGGFWVVDERNHVVRCFDECGRFVREVGGPGLGTGRLILPQFAGQFSDGVLVISQNQIDHTLVLLSSEGIELDRLALDYTPGGVAVADKMLFVAEFSGNHLRVYERT